MSSENGSDQLPDRRIGDLLRPGQNLATVRPDDPLKRAISIMKYNDYSQLPVLSNGDEPKAIITWESIGKRVFSGDPYKLVSDCMDTSVIKACFDDPLVGPTKNIAKHGYVLIMEDDETVKGIVTASDLATYFGEFAEGFLLIEKIENLLEKLTDEKPPKGNNALTYYYNCLEEPANFNRLGLDICHETFKTDLKSSKCIRNAIMHFDSGRPTHQDLEKLREFLSCLGAPQ